MLFTGLTLRNHTQQGLQVVWQDLEQRHRESNVYFTACHCSFCDRKFKILTHLFCQTVLVEVSLLAKQQMASAAETHKSKNPVDLYLIIVHGDIQFIVKFESQAPYDSPEPQAVVGVHRLCLCSDVQDVLALVQRTHILTYTETQLLSVYLQSVAL